MDVIRFYIAISFIHPSSRYGKGDYSGEYGEAGQWSMGVPSGWHADDNLLTTASECIQGRCAPQFVDCYKDADCQVIRSSGHQDIRSSGHQVIRSSGHQDIRSSGHQDIRSSGPQIIRISGHQDIRTSGHQDIRSSGHQVIR